MRLHKTIAVNNPGGQPRQYCVQIRNNNDEVWKRSAVFQSEAQAAARIQELLSQGLEARVVHYRLPTAA